MMRKIYLISFKNEKILVTNDKILSLKTKSLAPTIAFLKMVVILVSHVSYFKYDYFTIKSKQCCSGNLKFIFLDLSSNLFRKKII